MHRSNSSFRKNNNSRLMVKAVVCVVGIAVLFFIAFTYKNYRLKEDKAPYVQTKEVFPFLEALLEINKDGLSMEDTNKLNELRNHLAVRQNKEDDYLSFEELQIVLYVFPLKEDGLQTDYKDGSWNVGLKDWSRIVELLSDAYGNGQIILENTLVLGMSKHIEDEGRAPIGEDKIYTGKKLITNCYWNIGEYLFSNVKAVIYKDKLLTIIDYADEKGVLRNVYFSDVSNNTAHLFYGGYHMLYPMEKIENYRESKEESHTIRGIADVYFDKGTIKIGDEKDNYVHGKLLQVSDSNIEIEGYEKYQIDENMQVYKLYGELKSMSKQDMRIGYSFSDYVIEDGKIVACLMIKEDDMDYIRVLLKNSNHAGRYHKEVSGYCTQDCEWIEYEGGVEKSRTDIAKGEKFRINKEDIERSGKRIRIVPSVLSGEIILESIVRSNGTPAYRGSLEITGEESGLIVVNEVLLEDYLCKVVPSEMPSSYPKEALMAQAVCARTYAYSKMLNAGLPEYGAHVDDSAGFQVYNNIDEQPSTTEAVKATHNTIALYNDSTIGAYYYSTSCGMGSDTHIWHGSTDTPEYLHAKEIGKGEDTSGDSVSFADMEYSPKELMDEDNFSNWIHNVKDSHYESEEGWYRWTYDVLELDAEHLEKVLQTRYEANPHLILTKNGQGFENTKIQKLGEIKDIEIVKRLPGGVADELLITGEKATVKVISELNIRYVLSDGITTVIRQTGDEADASSTLPSAFIVLETIKEDDTVTGYKISGGGFGHGVGMSQNGAKNMAWTGMDYEEILTFFYPGITLKTLQFEEET